MPCTACKRDLKIAARGLCRACYSRWQRTGTTDYQKKRARNFCPIDGCGKPVVSQGMCDTHRKRFERHGHVEPTRPDSWGAIRKHPLSDTWRYLMRYRATHPVDKSWHDFLQFVADVGERPSPLYKLFRILPDKPIGPKNFFWRPPLTLRADGEGEKECAARRQRTYRSMRQEAFSGYEIKRQYGMTRSEYIALLEKQNGVCAICKRPSGTKIRGKVIALAVDHCHAKGAVRGLLCTDCNRGLGCFKDSPETLERAAEYLRWPERLV